MLYEKRKINLNLTEQEKSEALFLFDNYKNIFDTTLMICRKVESQYQAKVAVEDVQKKMWELIKTDTRFFHLKKMVKRFVKGAVLKGHRHYYIKYYGKDKELVYWKNREEINQDKTFFLGKGGIKFNRVGETVHISGVGRITGTSDMHKYEKHCDGYLSYDDDNNWSMSFSCLPTDRTLSPDGEYSIGIDVGIKTLIAMSDGKRFKDSYTTRWLYADKDYKAFGEGKQRDSKEMYIDRKIKEILNKKMWSVANYIRKQLPDRVVIEDLSGKDDNPYWDYRKEMVFKGMKNKLKWMCEKYQIEFVIASKWYPSSKLCSKCGHKKDKLKLSTRHYSCRHCGLEMDRDLNAAKNLAKYTPNWDMAEDFKNK